MMARLEVVPFPNLLTARNTSMRPEANRETQHNRDSKLLHIKQAQARQAVFFQKAFVDVLFL